MYQQPPNQYSSYPQQQQWVPPPQQQWQQQPYPPQRQWQQQPYPPQYQPPFPPTPPPKRDHKKLWIILGVAFALLMIISAVALWAGNGSQSDTTGTASQVTQPVQPTKAAQSTKAAQPTKAAQLTKVPTHPITNAGSAILGADISAFIAKYGQPHSVNGQQNNGGVSFSLYGNRNQINLTVTTENAKALAILEGSPTDQGWNESEAIAACLAFAPPDSTYKREMTLLDPQGNPTDIQRVYYSPSLAKLFPASDFTDENASLTTPGTFAMVLGYNLNSTSSFLNCSAQVGLQAI